MNRNHVAAWLTALLVGVACSSNSDDHAPTVSAGGGSSRAGAGGRSSANPGGSGGKVAAAGVEDGGSAGSDAGAGGAAGEGGGSDEGMVVPVTPGACSETALWADEKPLDGISTSEDERLLAITPDELDIVFLRGAVAMLAHRGTARQAFADPIPLTVADGYDINAGAALSADGKTLVLLASTGQNFAAFTRAARNADFDTAPDDSAFTALNQRALQTMQHYAAPVLAPDGKSFIFTAFTPEPEAGFPSGFAGVSVVYESMWTANGWAMPESISRDLFDGTTAARPLPSGLSSDSRTLFYFEEGSGKQMARFRDRPDAPLYTVVDLDQRTRAAPDVKCDRLYYSSGGDILVGAN